MLLRIVLIFISFGLLGLTASADPLPAQFKQLLRNSDIPEHAVGLLVQEVNATKPLLELNAAQMLTPASTMKLLTSAAALDMLGANYHWQTRVYADGIQQQDVLHGNLYIKGSGDPGFVIEDFWLLLNQLRAKGIREIDGNLLLDRSAFAAMPFDAAAFDQDPTRPYNAGANALLMNYDALGLQLSPGAILRVNPDLPMQITIDNHVQQVGGECGDWKSQLQADFSEQGTGLHVDIHGKYATACGDKTWLLYPYPVSQDAYFGAVFRRLWQELGGSFSGKIVPGSVPESARLLTSWTSASLADELRAMNKYSNNVMARQVYLTLGAEISQQTANLQRSQQTLDNWLQEQGWHGVVNENGSGLSRVDSISAQIMAGVLLKAWHAPTMPEFVSSLALLGQDGTVRKRLVQSDAAGQAHLKTGTMNGVRAIAGYVHARSGHDYVLVMMVNHVNAARAAAAQDALLQWVFAQH